MRRLNTVLVMALVGGLGCPSDAGGGDEGADEASSTGMEPDDDEADPSAAEDDDDPSGPSGGPGSGSASASESESASASGTDTMATDGTETESSDTEDPSESDTSSEYECPPPDGSVCSNGNSIIGGRVQLAPGIDDDGVGSVVVILTHKALGGGDLGGFFHTSGFTEADLSSAPAEFQLDMCTGGMMWSEDNCGYQLTVILDKNGNNGPSNMLPDPGEPSWATDLDLSCNGPPPCFDIELDCVDGPSCASFADGPYCGCNPPGTCGSEIVAC